MWIATKSGYLSIVRNSNPDCPAAEEMLVRSRVREDLEYFAGYASSSAHYLVVRCTPEADYPYRLFCSRSAVARFLASQADEITYENFKSEIAKTDRPRALVYTRVWAALHGLTPSRSVPE